MGLLEQLPAGFAKDFRLGLGVLWEYRAIVEMIGKVPGVTTLVLHGGGEASIHEPFYVLGIERFHLLRKEIRSIAARYQRDARKEKDFVVYDSLLHGADPKLFVRQRKRLRPDAIAELTRSGTDRATMSQRDRVAAVRLVQDSLPELSEKSPRALMELKSEIELVTLDQLIACFEKLLKANVGEAQWQRFFSDNPFVLSMAFAVPVMLIQGQAYVGGKFLDNSEGRVADFLMASIATGNLALIEIKHPGCDVVGNRPYRGGTVFAASAELSGAVAQVLEQRLALQKQLPLLKDASGRDDVHGHAIRCVVLIGTCPTEHQQRKSFELVRNAMSGVDILTFDEIGVRLKELRSALTPAQIEPPF